ncbi:MAG: hypothetical protein JSR67_03825 [Proteobacteria bacterium]|nr:hypothetical protein [Pseudomonadota bacterium]
MHDDIPAFVLVIAGLGLLFTALGLIEHLAHLVHRAAQRRRLHIERAPSKDCARPSVEAVP